MDQAKQLKIKIVTDSGCDISKEDEEEYNIDIIPFEIVVGSEIITERIDISPEDFYRKIDDSPDIPKTSQITTLRFEERFRQCAAQGYDEIIVIPINSTGSATYSNALVAKGMLEDEGCAMKIHVVDSHCYSVGYGYPVVEAAKRLKSGQSADYVIGFLEDWFNCCEIYIIAFGLRHLKKSGRVNAAAAFLGELVGLKPLISLIDGNSEVVKKSRGEKAVIADSVEYISKRAKPETPWLILRTTVTDCENEFIKQYTKKVGSEPSMVTMSGGVVSSNAGTTMIGVVIKGQPRR